MMKLLLFLFFLSLASFDPLPDTVTIETGVLKGIVNSTGRYFLGVPFAAPPTGNYRFTAPRPPSPWEGTRLATTFAPGCVQDCTLPPLTCPPTVSEDCLYLDVYTPLNSSSEPYPCMIFFPGGEFLQGGASTVLYDGTTLASITNTIVVVMNFRLGALGFLVNEEFAPNNGFLDQQFAMDWMRRNIHQFGGNPKEVTIFGQSAGGTSTTSHLISPLSKGLFNKAIVESNPIGLALNTMEQQLYYSSLFTKLVGCPEENTGDAERTRCLLGLSADDIILGQNKLMKHVNLSAPLGIFYPWTPTVDGYNVPGQPANLYPKGEYNDVPMMIGTVHDEGWLFIWEVQPKPIPAAEYYILLNALFGSNSGAVRQMYPVGPLTLDSRPVLNDVLTDYLFTCPSRYLAQNMLKFTPKTNVFVYQFNHVMSFYEGWGDNYQFCWFNYVCHASELPFVFDSATLAGFTPTSSENVLGNNMVKYWGNFANTGNPNIGPGGAADYEWPLYSLDGLKTMNLNLTLGEITDLRGSYCDFWDALPGGYFQP